MGTLSKASWSSPLKKRQMPTSIPQILIIRLYYFNHSLVYSLSPPYCYTLKRGSGTLWLQLLSGGWKYKKQPHYYKQFFGFFSFSELLIMWLILKWNMCGFLSVPWGMDLIL